MSDLPAGVSMTASLTSTTIRSSSMSTRSRSRQSCDAAVRSRGTRRYDGFWMATSYAAVNESRATDETFAHKYDPMPTMASTTRGRSESRGRTALPPLGSARWTGRTTPRCAECSTRSSQAAVACFGRSSETAWIGSSIRRSRTATMDLVLDSASPVPALVTMKMMGLPYEDWAAVGGLLPLDHRVPAGDRRADPVAAVPDNDGEAARVPAYARSRGSGGGSHQLAGALGVRRGSARRREDPEHPGQCWTGPSRPSWPSTSPPQACTASRSTARSGASTTCGQPVLPGPLKGVAPRGRRQRLHHRDARPRCRDPQRTR